MPKENRGIAGVFILYDHEGLLRLADSFSNLPGANNYATALLGPNAHSQQSGISYTLGVPGAYRPCTETVWLVVVGTMDREAWLFLPLLQQIGDFRCRKGLVFRA